MSKQLHILVLNWQDILNPLAGGAEVNLHEIFSRIAARGHTVTLFCSMFEGAKTEETLDGIRIIRGGNRNFFNYYVPSFYKKFSRANHVDVVVDDINKIPFYTPLYVKQPIIARIHHLFGKSIFLEVNFLAASYVSFAEKLIHPIYKKIPMLADSESTAAEIEQIGFPKKQISLVYNCVNHTIFHQTGVKKSPTPLVGFLGRLKKYKSVEHSIRAFAIIKKNIPNAQFLIVGDGDYKPVLEKLVRELQLENSIRFTGFVPEEEKVTLLQTMHVTVQPSAKEGWGLTVVEANACGVTCVASNVEGLREAVVDGQTGFLYDYGNIEQLAEKTISILTNETLRTKLEENALEWAKKFDWENSASKVLQIIENITNK